MNTKTITHYALRITNCFLALLLSLILLTGTAFASPAWQLPKHGKIFNDDNAKQSYITNYMEKFFHGEIKMTFAVPDKWKYEKLSIKGTKVERLINPAQKKSSRVAIQLHGGGYIGSLSDWYRDFGIKQAVMTDAREIYMVDYRIAPENLYPAALEDAANVYSELLNRGVDPKKIIILGDSAGGNLALELSLYLKEKNLPQPAMLILISPWTTFEADLPSRTENVDRDKILGKINPVMYNEVSKPTYGGDIPLNDPRLSPIYADLKNLPPMLIQIGGYELFTDEGIELLRKATADDVSVTLSVYRGMSHDFSVLLPELDDSIKAFTEVKSFVNLHMKK